MKNRVLILLAMLTASIWVSAQHPHHKFSPEEFDKELRQYIIKDAKLTQQEADKFFPVYQEMREKQRALFVKQKKANKEKPATDEACKRAVQERDEQELEQKRIQQTYHNKFLQLLPASKVYDVLRAEDRFHRHKIKQWGGAKGRPQKKRD